ADKGAPPPPLLWKARLRKRLWQALRLVVIAYLAMIVGLVLFQERFLFPGSATQGKRDARVYPAAGIGPVTLTTAQGETVKALVAPAVTISNTELVTPRKDAVQRPTILYFYGNGSYLKQIMDFQINLRSLETNLLILEYPGYGISGGSAGE